MRTRETHINVRTTPEEKERFERNARLCGMSLSAYLRTLANGHTPKVLPPLEYSELMRMISNLYADFNETGERKYAELLVNILLEMQAAITPDKRGTANGNDKNLADS